MISIFLFKCRFIILFRTRFSQWFLYQVVQPVIDDAPAGTPHADRSFFSWRCMINMGDYVIEDELESQGEIDEYDQMFFSKKTVEKIVILRIIVGDSVLNQNLNMALSHYGLNLKELKIKIDNLTSHFPKGLTIYFNFILYKNGTYDIFLKGPTLANSISNIINQDYLFEVYKLKMDDLILFFKFKIFLFKLINSYNIFFFKKLYTEYKQLLGLITSFKTT